MGSWHSWLAHSSHKAGVPSSSLGEPIQHSFLLRPGTAQGVQIHSSHLGGPRVHASPYRTWSADTLCEEISPVPQVAAIGLPKFAPCGLLNTCRFAWRCQTANKASIGRTSRHTQRHVAQCCPAPSRTQRPPPAARRASASAKLRGGRDKSKAF